MADYTDSLSLSDALHVVQGSAVAGDALGLSDSLATAVPSELGDTLTDAAGLTDFLHVVTSSALAGDVLGLSDAGFEAPLPLPWTDDLGLSDSLTVAVSADQSPTDDLGLSDSVDVELLAPAVAPATPDAGPTVPAVGRVWRLMPDYVHAADDGTMQAFADAAEVGLSRAAAFLSIVDADQSVSGSCELTNPAACPRAYLPWLGWLLGVDAAALADADVREAISSAGQSQRRGSVGAIRRAVQRTLTGAKSVRVFANVGGASPYLLTVVTATAQTPDSAASLLAAWTEKPAGVDLELQVVAGATWADLAAEYATWDDVAAALPTWADVSDWVPA